PVDRQPDPGAAEQRRPCDLRGAERGERPLALHGELDPGWPLPVRDGRAVHVLLRGAGAAAAAGRPVAVPSGAAGAPAVRLGTGDEAEPGLTSTRARPCA